MKAIGGYFELELGTGTKQYHDAPCLKSGRASLRLILDQVCPSLVYVPYYTCDSLLEPFHVCDIPYRFYEINAKFEPVHLPDLKTGEYCVYVNYFGLKDNLVKILSERYGDKLIVDCTQAFFMKGNGISWFFNSCRKFFGVPDGSYLYTPENVAVQPVASQNEKYTIEHLVKRFNGHVQEGYPFFLQNEAMMDCDVVAASILTQHLMSQVNYEEVIAKRKANFLLLHEQLRKTNKIGIPVLSDEVPMCYPYIGNNSVERQKFFADSIFIPTFWKEVMGRADGFELEKGIAQGLLPLPVDHRYSTDDMKRLASAVLNVLV